MEGRPRRRRAARADAGAPATRRPPRRQAGAAAERSGRTYPRRAPGTRRLALPADRQRRRQADPPRALTLHTFSSARLAPHAGEPRLLLARQSRRTVVVLQRQETGVL